MLWPMKSQHVLRTSIVIPSSPREQSEGIRFIVFHNSFKSGTTPKKIWSRSVNLLVVCASSIFLATTIPQAITSFISWLLENRLSSHKMLHSSLNVCPLELVMLRILSLFCFSRHRPKKNREGLFPSHGPLVLKQHYPNAAFCTLNQIDWV